MVSPSVLMVGCRESAPEFGHDRVRAMSLEISRDLPTEAAMQDVSVVVDKLFGTPQSPRWPRRWMRSEAEQNLVSLQRLEIAAGGVRSDQANVHSGLYQEHCVICHGIAGSGTGAASRLQVPYPRDFRAGVFKWKSTTRSEKPTRDDLERALVSGIPGTPMPSFRTLPSSDRDALVDYVIYLSVRGEVERRLLAHAVDMLDYDESAPADELRIQLRDEEALAQQSGADSTASMQLDELSDGQRAIADVIHDVVGRWVSAESSPVPPQPSDEGEALAASVARGRELFNGPVVACAGCHGQDGVGGLPSLDYDDWTKEFTTRIGITPEDTEAVKPFRKAGALPPRKIEPRVLAEGLLRGGDDPETLYRRIHHGIAGTPMPGIEIVVPSEEGTGVSPRDVWDLVNFLEAMKN
ncbi:cytochrome c [Allorhodopirellula solitaria]|nr:c-type cytochrome [Allorhodopirellula solitaria]